MNGKELRSVSHYQILTYIAYQDLSRKLETWLILKFVFIHSKTVKISQDYHFRMQTLFTSIFLMEGEELRSFSYLQILTKIGYLDISRNLQIDKFWSVSSLTVKLWKSVKMIKFKYKDNLQVFSSWLEKN